MKTKLNTNPKTTTPAVVSTPTAPVISGGCTLGLDLGDRSHFVCVLDAAGQIIHEGPKVGRAAPRAPSLPIRGGARGATRPTNLTRAKVIVICHRTGLKLARAPSPARARPRPRLFQGVSRTRTTTRTRTRRIRLNKAGGSVSNAKRLP